MDLKELISEFRADPPSVHRPGYQAGYTDWNSRYDSSGTTYMAHEDGCYEFIGERIRAGSVTLETGLGLSTLVFALRRCNHTAMFLDDAEEAPLRNWAEQHGIDTSTVRFIAGPSDESLRSCVGGPLDLFFIDGGHGYPLPQLDFFYGASNLAAGGTLVLDDLQLWAPSQLDKFLTLDPRWVRLIGSWSWSAHLRLVSGPIAEDFDMQTFLPSGDEKELLGAEIGRRIHIALGRRLPASVKAPVRKILGGG